MIPNQNPSNEEHAWKNWIVYLLMLLSTFMPHAIPMHAVCAHSVRYSLASKEVSYTQDLWPDDLSHNLGTPKFGL